MIKKLIPAELRLGLRVLQRFVKDYANGHKVYFVNNAAREVSFRSRVDLSQPIKKNDFSKNKIHNLKLGASFINNKCIEPGQILSFWHLIPRPIAKNDFKKGRNLIGDGLATDYGGGLCQLSGILYHLGLMAGMEIIERHSHSLDIYTEESRYTPLGSDATVVYGYKDLRLRNRHKHPISFRIEIYEDLIRVHFCATQVVEHYQINFERINEGDYHLAKVTRIGNEKEELISEDSYLKMKH